MSVELGPGIIENIYDGIQRPLEGIMRKAGNNNLPRGVEVPALDREKKWDFTAVAKVGDHLSGGDVLGTLSIADTRKSEAAAVVAQQRAAGKGCDALPIPVGGYYTIDAKTAKKVADAIAPRVLVPMHYRFGAHGYPEIGTLDEFLALYEAKKIHKLDGNSFELTKNAPAGVIVPRFAE